jgi:peptidoglycan/LPS O-acetylase OafA/YrhL
MSVILIVLGVVLQIFEARFLYDRYAVSAYDHEFLFGTIPFAIGMAGLALNDLKWTRYPIFSNWGRDYSLGIYLIHPLVIYISAKGVSWIMPALGDNPIWQGGLPLLVLALCLLILGVMRRFLPTWFDFLYGRHRPA